MLFLLLNVVWFYWFFLLLLLYVVIILLVIFWLSLFVNGDKFLDIVDVLRGCFIVLWKIMLLKLLWMIIGIFCGFILFV